MIWLVGSLVYGISVLVAARAITGHFAWKSSDHYGQQEPDGSDWFFGALGGVVCGLVWPTLILAFFAVRALRCGAGHVPVLAIGAEARAKDRLRKRRIAELERELDLR